MRARSTAEIEPRPGKGRAAWPLRRQFLVAFAVLLVAMVVLVVQAVVDLATLGAASDAILRENYRSIRAVTHMLAAAERHAEATRDGVRSVADGPWDRTAEAEREFLAWLLRARDNLTIEGEGELVGRVEARHRALVQAADRTRRLSERGADAADAAYREQVVPALVALRAELAALLELNEAAMIDASARAQRLADRTRTTTTVVGGLAVVLGALFARFASRRLVAPLERLVLATRQVADGDYDVHLDAARRDEFGLLAAEFLRMARRLAEFQALNVLRLLEEKGKSEAVLRGIDDGIVVIDAEMRVTELNPMAARVLDVPAEAARGRHFLEVVRDERLLGYVRQAASTRRAPEIPEGGSVIALGGEDARRYYLFSVTPVDAAPGGAPRVVLLLRDVTRLKELDRLKSDFVATASHELRTPLTAVSMSVALIRESLGPALAPRDAELLAAAEEELARLRRLVDELLDVSRLESGRIELDFAPVDLRVPFDKVSAVLRPQAEQRRVELVFELPDDLPEVRVDVGKIAWVLVNLVGNALRYTPEGGHVRVSAERAGAYVEVAVRDDGPGIPPEYQSRIFEKFVRVPGGETAGTGLGLAICREVVRAHRGAIWVESEPGRGSTFRFTVPLAEPRNGGGE